MPIIRKIIDGDCVTGIWQMTETVEELERRYAMKPDEEATFRNFRNNNRRREWLTVRLLLSELTDETAQISYHPSGRPFLTDRRKCISISHTIGYVAIRLSSHPVALDIEYKSERVLRITSKFMNPREKAMLDTEDPVSVALTIWSAKETIYKLFDMPDLAFDTEIEITDYSADGHLMGRVDKKGFSTTVRMQYDITDTYVLVYH